MIDNHRLIREIAIEVVKILFVVGLAFALAYFSD